MGGSFPLLIQNEAELADPVREKWVGSSTIDPEQIQTVLK
jgi:hypothetical protein